MRTTNTLEEAGILLVRDLLACCPKKQAQCERQCDCRAVMGAEWPGPRRYLLDIENFGRKTRKEVLECLADLGFGGNGDMDANK